MTLPALFPQFKRASICPEVTNMEISTMTPRQEVIRFAATERIRIDARHGAVLLAAKDTDWLYVADDWRDARAELIRHREANYCTGARLPWRS